jgi:hypothetical protein
MKIHVPSIRPSLARTSGALVLALAVALAACAEEAPPEVSPQDQFWTNLQAYCGQAFEGEVTEIGGIDPEDFAGPLVMHVRECFDDEIRIPFHVGDNHSRTWILTRTDEGLRLKHDHRHEDGTEEELTQYGGDTTEPGTATTQRFPVDDFTVEMLPEAATNVWTMEVVPGDYFAYQLVREGTDRHLRVEFDLTEEVPTPPTPWGWDPLP